MEAPPLSEEELNQLYNWVDEVPLSRPKKNIARDFADGVLVAEIVAHFIPKIVEVHNYVPANSTNQKLYNWNTLNQKVFKKLGFQLNKKDIESVITCQPEAIERILKIIQVKIDKYFERLKNGEIGPDTDNGYIPGYGYGGNNLGAGAGVGAGARNQQQYGGKVSSGSTELQGGSGGSNGNGSGGVGGDQNMIFAKDQAIQELKETIEILELKIKKLEQLVKLKDSKIQTLQNKLSQHGIN